MIKCQTKVTLEIAIDVLVTKQCQLIWILRQQGTINIFDYQTANAGVSPPSSPSFLKGDENQRFLSEKY